jgi:tetratricopeptide (TPR) repeat protein
MGQNTLALDAIGHHLRTHPKDAEALVLSIEVAAQLGRNDRVTAGLQRLARLPGQRARAVGDGAVIRAESLGLEAGIGLIESAELDLTDPRHIEALRALVQLLEAGGRRAAALARAEAALAAHPDQAPFHALRGELLRGAGRSDEARVAFQAAVELDPDHAPALVGLAEIARESGDTREAIALYDRDTEQPGPRFSAAELLRESGRVEEAEQRLRSLLQDHPLHGPSAYALTRLLMDRGAFDAAEPWAERAVALHADPEAPETLERVQLRSSS